MPINEEWLEKVVEEAIEPELPIIDPHHHLWNTGNTYVDKPYMAEELILDLDSGHNILATVFVECSAFYRDSGPKHLRPVGETEFVNRVADESAGNISDTRQLCAGIVGHADLTLGKEVDEVLEAHLEVAPDRMRGIRHSVPWDPSPDIRVNREPGLLANAKFREGARRLAAYNLSFEAWLYHPQIPELTAFAKACPDVTIVFDHFGGPLGIGPYIGKRSEIYQQWKDDVTELSACPNVFAKLGGLNMAINGFGWHKRIVPPSSNELAANNHYYLHTIDQFGPERCMFESNFPVDKVSCSYGVLWNSFKKMVSHLSRTQKAALFHDTAEKVYRLKND